MTTTQLRQPPPSSPPTQTPRPRLQLSATQLVASALAAVTATVAASYLGVSGTVIGAAVASVLTVTGNAVYSHSLHRTGQKVRTVVPAGARWIPPPAEHPVAPIGRTTSWRVMAAACAAVFAAVLILVTGFEFVAGRPLSDLVQGKAGQGTTLLGETTNRPADAPRPQPAPTVTVTVTPSVVTVTPTITQTAPAVTATVPNTTTPTPTGSSEPTPTPTTTPPPDPTPTPTTAPTP